MDILSLLLTIQLPLLFARERILLEVIGDLNCF
jgi:hypothetical protein